MAAPRRSPFLRALAALRDAFEEEAITKAERINYAGVKLPFARPEDLLIYKLIAHRRRDIDDAERLFVLHGDSIDLARVRAVLRAFSAALDGPDRLRTLSSLVKSGRRTG